MTERPTWPYPALVAVVGQDRQPSFAEMRVLVRRVRLEVAGANFQPHAHKQMVRGLVMGTLKSSSPDTCE